MDFLSGVLGNAFPQAGQAYSQFLGPQGAQDLSALFQQTAIDPALQALQQQIIPGIQQQFANVDAGSSSALNQALAEAAKDVTTQLGGKFGDFFQKQQANQIGALGQLGGLAGTRTFEPTTVTKQGWLPGALEGISRGVAGAFSAGLL